MQLRDESVVAAARHVRAHRTAFLSSLVIFVDDLQTFETQQRAAGIEAIAMNRAA